MHSDSHGIFCKVEAWRSEVVDYLYFASPKWCEGDFRDFKVDFTPLGVWIVSFPNQVNQMLPANGRKSESKAFCFLWNIIDLLGLGTVSSSFKNIDVLFSLLFANWRI